MQKSSKVAACVAGCIMALIFIKKAIRSLKASGTRVFEDSVDHMTKLDSIVDRLTDGDGETASRAELADELYFYSKKMPDGQRMLKLETNFKIKGNSDSPSTITKKEYGLEESDEVSAESLRRDVGYLKSLQENNMVPGSLLGGKGSA